MKIYARKNGTIVLEEIYDKIILRTDDSNEIEIKMKNDLFEIGVTPKGRNTAWYWVNMITGAIEQELFIEDSISSFCNEPNGEKNES